MSQEQQITAKAQYDKLKTKRSTFIDRAVQCAEVTIPSLFLKEGATGNDKLKTPYQSVGARGVNNLASKLVLALFPPNSTFFRLGLTPEVETQIQGDPEAHSQVEQTLMSMENTISKYMEANQIRVTIFEGIKQLLVAGNCLLFLPPAEGGAKLYDLKNYVIQRDALGNVITLITKDSIAKSALPPEIKSKVPDKIKEDQEVHIYTRVIREEDRFVSSQEYNGEVIAGSEQQYPLDKTPYIPMRMVKQDGESYGRSFVEEYLGDLNSLEQLSKALNMQAMIAATVLYLVNPNGITRASRLQKAKSGDFISGRREDIGVLQLDKYYDLQVAQRQADALEQRLSFAFLLSSVVQRHAERVTAEEIRTVAGELEDTLGGVYSLLSQELQLPLVRRIMNQLMSQTQIPNLPSGIVEPTITTGMEALGRGHDLNKYAPFMQIVGQLPTAMERLNLGKFIMDVATSVGIETQGLVKSDEELQQEQMQQMAQQEMLAGMRGEEQPNGN